MQEDGGKKFAQQVKHGWEYGGIRLHKSDAKKPEVEAIRRLADASYQWKRWSGHIVKLT